MSKPLYLEQQQPSSGVGADERARGDQVMADGGRPDRDLAGTDQPAERRRPLLHPVLPQVCRGPEDMTQPSHRIASTNQPPKSMATRESTVRGVCGVVQSPGVPQIWSKVMSQPLYHHPADRECAVQCNAINAMQCNAINAIKVMSKPLYGVVRPLGRADGGVGAAIIDEIARQPEGGEWPQSRQHQRTMLAGLQAQTSRRKQPLAHADPPCAPTHISKAQRSQNGAIPQSHVHDASDVPHGATTRRGRWVGSACPRMCEGMRTARAETTKRRRWSYTVKCQVQVTRSIRVQFR